MRDKKSLKQVNKMKVKRHNVFDTLALMIDEELEFLLDTIDLYKGVIKTAVELGCYAGGTSIEMLKVFLSHTTLYCVDSFVINGDDAKKNFNNLVLAKYSNVKLLERTTHDAAGEFDKPIDFLLVDADHQEHSIQEDCRDWLPKVRSGGWVAFHDYQHPHFPKIKPNVDEATKGWFTVGCEGHLLIRQKV